MKLVRSGEQYMHRCKGVDLVMHVYYHVGGVVALVLVCRRTFLYLMSIFFLVSFYLITSTVATCAISKG